MTRKRKDPEEEGFHEKKVNCTDNVTLDDLAKVRGGSGSPGRDEVKGHSFVIDVPLDYQGQCEGSEDGENTGGSSGEYEV